ncbi:hypothetical protein GF345_04760 [Candidatus Woesearchaeota archaeon]|nr:hypothetical protein [Candidatus Woesearchaeota archaeon]
MGDLGDAVEKTWKQRLYGHRGKITAGVTAVSMQDNIRSDINTFSYYLDILQNFDEADASALINHTFESIRSDTLHFMLVSFAAYYALHRLGRDIGDEEIEEQINRLKEVHDGAVDSHSDAKRNLKTFGLGLAAGLSPWAAHYIGGSLESLDPQEMLELSITSFQFGVGTFFLSNYLMGYMPFLDKPKVRNFYDMICNAADGAYYSLVRKREQAVGSIAGFTSKFRPEMRKIRTQMASGLVNVGRYEDAMELFKSEIENFDIMEKRGFVDLMSAPFVRAIEFVFRSSHDIAKIFDYLPEKPGKFLNKLDKYAGRSGETDVMALNAIAHSKFCSGPDREERVRSAWGDVVEKILEMPENEFQRLGESSNEVLIYKPRDRTFISDLLALKRGNDGESILKDYFINVKLEGVLREQGLIIVPEPLDIYYSNDQLYSILKLEDSPDIASTPREEWASSIPKVVMNLASLQGFMTRELKGASYIDVSDGIRSHRVQLGQFDYFKEINKRILSRFGNNEHSDNLAKTLISNIHDNKIGMPFFIQGDFYSTNALASGKILDLERSANGDPVLDFSLFCLSTDLSQGETMISPYTEYLCDSSGHSITIDQTRRSFYAHLPFYSFCLSGSRLHHGDPESAKHYIALTKSIMEDMGLHDMRDSFMHYSEKCLEPSL